jgi:hypothetical protein
MLVISYSESVEKKLDSSLYDSVLLKNTIEWQISEFEKSNIELKKEELLNKQIKEEEVDEIVVNSYLYEFFESEDVKNNIFLTNAREQMSPENTLWSIRSFFIRLDWHSKVSLELQEEAKNVLESLDKEIDIKVNWFIKHWENKILDYLN